MELARGQLELHADWGRLVELARVEVDRVFAMAEHILAAEVRSKHPYVSVKGVKPLLERAFALGTQETQGRAGRLVHRLGDRGFIQLGNLLEPE